ncbi:MAG: GHMP kinase [Spirochaetaceae bacterium]|nr:GHMP kinase [Spirochaetaceae bacterium]MCF7949637.1 GHMP kinase [Spirochaetia bacterium]MCF7951842.1 GHMP kinase [Spirochaetaceae bacterium]
MNSLAAYAPGHVTGIFFIDDLDTDPLKRGSLGAGFSIDLGATTRIAAEDNSPETGISKTGPRFILNGEPRELDVSAAVYTHFIESQPNLPHSKLTISHKIDLPQGSGFGTSGAGALSLAMALNRWYGGPFSNEEAAQFAHRAEVECKTGLGTVIGEYYGGFEIRTRTGAPGIGRITHIPYPEDLRAVFAVRGPYSTSEALSSREVRDVVNLHGKNALEGLQRDPNVNNFLRYSRQFAEGTGLFTPWVTDIIEVLDAHHSIGSMLMFGEGVFTLAPPDKAIELEAELRSYCERTYSRDTHKPVVFSAGINSSGGTLL